jgi:multiple sugar transport system permease protein
MARGGRGSLLDRPEWLGPLMIGPAVLYIVLLVGLPFVLALFYSVSDITMGSRTLNFVGLRNFLSVMETTKFQTSLRNTFVFAVTAQVLVMVLGTILAMALLKDFRGKWLVRLLLLLPWVAPISLGTIGWLWILDSTYSVINWTLEALGVIGLGERFMWLGVPHLAMGSIVTVHVWRILPLATVILLAGLFGLVLAFTDMIVIFVLTRGGPYDTTQVLASLAFFTGVQAGDIAEGAAVALFLFPLLVVVAIVLLRVARRTEVV